MAKFQVRYVCQNCGRQFESPDLISVDDRAEVDPATEYIHSCDIGSEVVGHKDSVAVHACNVDPVSKRVLTCGIGRFIGLRKISDQ